MTVGAKGAIWCPYGCGAVVTMMMAEFERQLKDFDAHYAVCRLKADEDRRINERVSERKAWDAAIADFKDGRITRGEARARLGLPK